MSKSLSESAAEILSASIGKASKESMPTIPSDEQEIGGPTTENPAGVTNPGAKAAAPVSTVAKPATKGDAKSVKVASMAEEEELTDEELDEILESMTEEELNELAEEELTDEELDEILESMTEEELNELLQELDEEEELVDEGVRFAKTDSKEDRRSWARLPGKGAGNSLEGGYSQGLSGEGRVSKEKYGTVSSPTNRTGVLSKKIQKKLVSRAKEGDRIVGPKKALPEDFDLPELSEEEILEARKAKMKSMVDSSMGSCKEDVDALFNGESLSEEFRTKATTIFEAAVRSRVDTIITQIAEENEKAVAAEVEEIQAALSEQVDEYLNYVVEQWMQENQLAIETGLRAEIAEDFINGLKNLFMEHYIEVPEEKADLVEEMAARVVESEELVEAMVEELDSVTKQLNEAKAHEILRRVCEGLTEMQVQKIKSLAEGVEFTTEGEYAEKLGMIRESYFANKPIKAEAPQTVVETAEDRGVSDVMDFYVNAITKQLPK